MSITIESLQEHVQNLKNGHESVKPGMPFILTNAASVGDGVWQGDLGLEVVDKIPEDYVTQSIKTQQLVPGNTIGSRHCLDSLDGVKIYFPKEWNEESLIGPAFTLTKERKVLHPTHGAITIAAGLTILCRYQREWDKEQAKERRTRD